MGRRSKDRRRRALTLIPPPGPFSIRGRSRAGEGLCAKAIIGEEWACVGTGPEIGGNGPGKGGILSILNHLSTYDFCII
jgi:hypothetical protein